MNIIEAAQLEDLLAMKNLLDARTDVDAQDETGRTALHWACQGGSDVIVNLLLAHNANPNASDDEGFTPLAVACGENNPSIIKSLLTSHADPNARIDALENGTVLHLVASWNRYEACAALFEFSAPDVSIRDRNGMTAVDYALDAKATRVFELLTRGKEKIA